MTVSAMSSIGPQHHVQRTPPVHPHEERKEAAHATQADDKKKTAASDDTQKADKKEHLYEMKQAETSEAQKPERTPHQWRPTHAKRKHIVDIKV